MTRWRIGVSEGKDSSSRSSRVPASGGGRYVSDGGRMLSTRASYGRVNADGVEGSGSWWATLDSNQ
jgi:hypothetical protein